MLATMTTGRFCSQSDMTPLKMELTSAAPWPAVGMLLISGTVYLFSD